MHDDPAASAEVPPIADRPEPVSTFGRWWPVLAIGTMVLLLIRACVPVAAPPAPPPFDVASAARIANARAFAALEAVTAATPMGEVLKALNLPVVNFAPASAEIPADAAPILEKAAAVMALLPASVRLEVAGFTDSTGTTAANLVLSKQRAQSIIDLFVANGIAADRLSAQGYGDTKPVADNATEEGRFHNRRIAIKALAQ